MTGCQTCGGYGNRHDPIAHDAEPDEDYPMTADDLCAVLLAHADSLDVRVNKHAGNETVLAQIARSTPAALRALVAEMRKP